MAFSDINEVLDCYLLYDNGKYKVTGVRSSSNSDKIKIYSFNRSFLIPVNDIRLQYFTGMIDSYGKKIYTGNTVIVNNDRCKAVRVNGSYFLEMLGGTNILTYSDIKSVKNYLEVRVLDND